MGANTRYRIRLRTCASNLREVNFEHTNYLGQTRYNKET